MKKIVALVLSLVMALSLCTVVASAETTKYDIDAVAQKDGKANYRVEYVEQTKDHIGYYKVVEKLQGQKLNVGDILVATDNSKLYESEYGYATTIDGKPVYMIALISGLDAATNGLINSTEAKKMVNALRSETVAEHKYVGCGDEQGKYPANCYKSELDNPNKFFVKYDDVKDANKDYRYVSVDGKFDNVVKVRAATVFTATTTREDVAADKVEVIEGGHLMVLVKENVEYKTSVDGKVVRDVNEYKCAFCGRTFYGSNYQYSTPETGKVLDYAYATNLVYTKLVNIDNGTILGNVKYYWTDDKGTGTVDTKKDGVDSAKTFDAGVAMYVGMSLLSVAGGAVVIGKKKEF